MSDSTSVVTAPPLAGIHHLKIAVTALDDGLAWYRKVFGAHRVPDLDHIDADGSVYAYVLQWPGLSMPVEMQRAPQVARRMRSFDPVDLAVAGRTELEGWVEFLGAVDVANSGVLRGVTGWLVSFRSPDGLGIRLFTDESHGVDNAGADSSPWLEYPEDDDD